MTRAVVLTIAALTVAACGSEAGGGGSTGPNASAAKDGPAEGAFKFAKCMRDNGVDFPDPEVDGNRIKLGGPDMKLNADAPKVKAAQKKCEKHLDNGVSELSSEDKAEMRDAGVKMAECMRANGVAKFPDPEADGSIMIRRRGEGADQGLDPESPAFQAAQKKCQHIVEEAHDKIEGKK
jgi:hypothetical protein